MDCVEFVRCRRRLNKTQKQLGQLLGLSTKAVHSYEQGWRSIPGHAERQILFLLARILEPSQPCWTLKDCPCERLAECPANEFKLGELCWFVNGTLCECKAFNNWEQKIAFCRHCVVFAPILRILKGEGGADPS